MSGPYVIRHGDVWRQSSGTLPAMAHMGDTHVCDGSQMMAVAYDSESGTLHKAGGAEGVEAWADATRKKFIEGGFPELGESIVVISFPPVEETVEELNACIATTGRVLRFQQALEAIGRTRPELFGRPVYPR